ncbi:MAG: hypothetical protein U0N15_04240 [Bifidobacterium choerinum]
MTSTDSHRHERPDHRVFDEFDVSQSMRLPDSGDALALIEAAMAAKIIDGALVSIDDEDLDEMRAGYTLDDCGNRHMRLDIMRATGEDVVSIDLTGIVETIGNLLQEVLNARMTDLKKSYDYRHHVGIYADDTEA